MEDRVSEFGISPLIRSGPKPTTRVTAISSSIRHSMVQDPRKSLHVFANLGQSYRYLALDVDGPLPPFVRCDRLALRNLSALHRALVYGCFSSLASAYRTCVFVSSFLLPSPLDRFLRITQRSLISLCPRVPNPIGGFVAFVA